MYQFFILIAIIICCVTSEANYTSNVHVTVINPPNDFRQPNNYKILEGYIYTPQVGFHKYYKIDKTWNEARKHCVNDGAHLAVVDSDAELKLLQSYATGRPIVWLGIHDFFEKKEWVTVLDQPLTYDKWTPGHLDNFDTERCAGLESTGFNNFGCDIKNYFICELVL